MAGARRNVPVLYSNPVGLDSHRVRFVLAEKGVEHSCEDRSAGAAHSDLLELNASGSLPTLVDRDLVLYDGRVIIDYLDERVPHPPLMPMDPVSRARTRLALYQMHRDWDSALPDEGDKMSSSAAKRLTASLREAAEVFSALPYFLSSDFSILDAMLGPLLWRLPCYGIVLSRAGKPVDAYARRLFARPGFQASLSSAERAMAES